MNKSCCHLIGSSWPMHAPSSEAKLQETRWRSDMSDASLTKTPQWFPMLVVCWATPAIPNAKLADSALTCEVTMQASASAKRRGWEHWNWCPKFRGNWVKGGSIFRIQNPLGIRPQSTPKMFQCLFSGLLHSKRILTFVVLSPTIGFAWHTYIYILSYKS